MGWCPVGWVSFLCHFGCLVISGTGFKCDAHGEVSFWVLVGPSTVQGALHKKSVACKGSLRRRGFLNLEFTAVLLGVP